MKKTIFISFLLVLACITMTAQGTAQSRKNAAQARNILDKTAAVVGNKGGASASFTMSNPKIGSASGQISIKGQMFHASVHNAIVWYNGKTQWSYMKSTNEVNVTTPSEAKRMKMNPYTFITMYKKGYDLSMSTSGANYVIHLKAQNKQRPVKELYITVNNKSYIPVQVKMLEGTSWSTINISNFKTKNLPNSMFTFNAKDFPTAEVIDLR